MRDKDKCTSWHYKKLKGKSIEGLWRETQVSNQSRRRNTGFSHSYYELYILASLMGGQLVRFIDCDSFVSLCLSVNPIYFQCLGF